MKFTRGDIVVDLAKLKFFQTRFTRDLISGAIPDAHALTHRILKPIQSELERLSQDLSKKQASALVAEVIGEEPKLRIHREGRQKQHTEEYVHEVLKVSKGLMENHRQFIRDNLYAFWSPSTLAYKNSFQEFQSGMKRIKLETKSHRILNMDISKVLLRFRTSLGKLKEEEWNLENVGNKAKELADSVTLYNTEKDLFMDHGVGWKFLRWGLFVGMPGLSVVPAMVLLGQEETLTRLRKARKCAMALEEKMAVEAKKAAKLRKYSRLHKRVMGQSTGEGQESLDDQVSEPRNVKVRFFKEKPTETSGKAKGFLRPMHHESHIPEKGPFVSQPQPRFLPVLKPENRPPKPFISLEEVKTGYRHILNEKEPESTQVPPRKWGEKRAKKISARRSEPADGIHPFAPGGSFFSPETEMSAGSGQPESTRPRTTKDPSDSASRTPQPKHAGTRPAPFQVMSDSERQLHYKHLMLQQAYERKRQASSARRLRLAEPRPGYPAAQPGTAPDNAPGPLGAFYAGPEVNHPLRVQANGGLAKDVEGQRPPKGWPQREPEKGLYAKLAEPERKARESWAKPGRPKRVNKAQKGR